MIEPIRTRALRLLRSAYFFCHLLRDLRRSGLVGEERNALVVYIVATSRLLSEPLALFVKGPSSVGKNFTTDKTLDLIPTSEVRRFTASSDKSWNYQDRNLAHKLVYLKERNDAAGPVHPLRLLISEQQLTYYVTVRRGNHFVVERVVTRGPIAAISTTTKDRVEVDDETRHLSIWLDDSAEQTRRIIGLAVQRELDGNTILTRDERACWHDVQRLLQGRAGIPIKFPAWLEQIGDSVSADAIRARRYFGAFLRAVKVIALIRSFRWTKDELLREGRILVDFGDVAIATHIFGPVFAQSLQRAEDMDVEVRQRIVAISARKDGNPVSAWELSNDMKMSMDKAYDVIRKAESAGTIYKANPSNRTNRKLYLPSQVKGFLPNPEEMFRQLTAGPKNTKFVHPLTGERVIYDR